MGAWIGLWALSAVVGFGLWKLAGPKIPGLDAKTQNQRMGILGVGFIPCFGINIITSIMFYTQYKFKTRGIASTQASLNTQLGQQTGFSPPSLPPSQQYGPQQQSQPQPGGAGSSNPFD